MADEVPDTDAWVRRINAAGNWTLKILTVVLVAVPGIIGAWQSINNNTEIKAVREYQNRPVVFTGK